MKVVRPLLLLLMLGHVVAQPAGQGSLRVVMDNNYPPFVFTDSEGKLQGLLIDEWRLWEARSGIQAQLQATNWNEALRLMKSGQADVIDTVFKTRERMAYWDFSKPYARIDVPIFFRKEISGITDLKSLKGFPVAAKAGDAAADLLAQNGIETVMLYTNYEAIIEAAEHHKANVFVMDEPPALYLLNQHGIDSEFRRSAPVNTNAFHRAVAKGNLDVLKTVEGGFARIHPAELRRLHDKWYGQALSGLPDLRYLGYAAGSGLLVILALASWSFSLKRLVRRRTAALQESQSRLRALLDHMPDWVWLKDIHSRYITANAPYTQAVNCSLEQLAGRSDAELWPAGDAQQFVAVDQAVIQSGQLKRVTEKVADARGQVRWLETLKAPVRNDQGLTIGTVGIARDITQRRRVEEALEASEKRFRLIFEHAPLGIFQSTRQGRLLRVNAAGAHMFGYPSPEEFVLSASDVARQVFVFPEQRPTIVQEALGRESFVSHEVEYRRKDGSAFTANLYMRAVRDPKGEAAFVEGFVEDITHRKQAEAELQRTNRMLRMVSECNQVLVRITDEAELLKAICNVLIRDGSYRLAWVGYAQQDEPRTVRPVAQAGFEAGYLERASISWADTERGRGPVGTAIRTGQPVVARNILTDPAFEPWRTAALERGYAALAGLPLKVEGRVLGALTVYTAQPDTFNEGEMALLQELADDLAYGIAALRTRVEHRQAEEDLHRLSARLLQVRDQERRHLARELHDTTAQQLAALTLNLSNLRKSLSEASEPTQALCLECTQLARQAALEIRTHSYLLHPPLLEAMGLVRAVDDYAQGFAERSGIAVELAAPKDFGRLPEETELALFRVIQESLTNVLKHARSPRALIRFTRAPSSVTLEVQDMGKGIPAEKLARIRAGSGGSGVGLAGMQERLRLLQGQLDIESAASGTTIRATVSLAATPQLSGRADSPPMR